MTAGVKGIWTLHSRKDGLAEVSRSGDARPVPAGLDGWSCIARATSTSTTEASDLLRAESAPLADDRFQA